MPRFDGGTSLTVSPAIWSVPEVMSSSPAIARRSVDFPQPDGPTKTMNSPVDAVQDLDVAVGFADVPEGKFGHGFLPIELC